MNLNCEKISQHLARQKAYSRKKSYMCICIHGTQSISQHYLRGCLHDTGATFIPVRVHSGSLFWLCIRLHDTTTKSHTGTSHTGASSPRFLYRSEIFTPVRKLVPMSCKHGTTVRSGMKSLSRESGTGSACVCLFNHTSADILCLFM